MTFAQPMEVVQSSILSFVQWLQLVVELTGALVIAVGTATSIFRFARSLA